MPNYSENDRPLGGGALEIWIFLALTFTEQDCKII